MLLNDNSKA